MIIKPSTATKQSIGLGNVTNDAQLKIDSNLSDVNDRQTALNGITAVSGASNEQVLKKDTTTGNVLWKNESSGSAPVNTIYVGSGYTYTKLGDAVDWFDASATSNTVIILATGEEHLVADTITVNNLSYNLVITGQDSSICSISADTGLTNKPMFDLLSNCVIRDITLIGSTLASYGTQATENAIDTSNNSGMVYEFVNIIIDGFYIGINDIIGAEIFVFNFIISNCTHGIEQNYDTGLITSFLDAEIGNFENCDVGINLVKATSGNFLLAHLYFQNEPGTQIAIQYNGTNFVAGSKISQMLNLNWNRIGTFLSGFDWTRTDGRDANIEFIGSANKEDALGHCKINIVGSSTTTTLTTQNTWYKANGTNTNSYTKKFTIADNKATYQSDNKKNLTILVSGNIQASTSSPSRELQISIVKNGNASTVYGTMAITIDQTNRNFAFSTNVYLEDIAKNDYFELWTRCTSASGVVVIVSNLALLANCH